MYGPAPRRGPQTPTEWVILSAFLLLILGLFVAEICDDYHPAKLAILLVVVFWIPLLALHEGGHAVAAALLGWRVGRVVVGVGKAVARFRLGTAAVEVRVVPVEGFVRCVPTRLRLPHLESALIYFAGPGVELLLAATVLVLVGPDRLFSASQDYELVVWRSLAVAAASQAVLNLLPFAVTTRDGLLQSDGLGIIVSFLRPTSYYARMIDWPGDADQEGDEASDPADWWKGGK
jgi:hypothetical protein